MGLFQKATKHQLKLRMAITGPSGSGKTYTALVAAKALANGGKIAVIDTEHGGASKYADLFEFDVVELDNFHPQRYIESIRAAEAGNYQVLVIDSLSHEWDGKGGMLEEHQKITERSASKNGYVAWGPAGEMQRDFVEAVLGCSMHVIATMRSKMDYAEDTDEKGRKVIRKVGLAPVQRNGIEYEFDVVGDMGLTDHVMVVSKSRCFAFADAVIKKPTGPDFAPLVAWLNSGDVPPPQTEETTAKTTQPTATTSAPTNGATKATRPYPPDVLQKGLRQAAAKGSTNLITPEQVKAVVIAMNGLFPNDRSREVLDIKRHGLLTWAFGKGSTKDLSHGEGTALLDWMRGAEAVQEAALVIKSLDLGIGQTEMPLEPEPQTEEVPL